MDDSISKNGQDSVSSMRPSHSIRGQVLRTCLRSQFSGWPKSWDAPHSPSFLIYVRGDLFQTNFSSFQFLTFIYISGGLIKTKMTLFLPKAMTSLPTDIIGLDSGTAVILPTCPLPSLARFFLLSCQKDRTFYSHFCPFNSQSTIAQGNKY